MIEDANNNYFFECFVFGLWCLLENEFKNKKSLCFLMMKDETAFGGGDWS